MKPRLTYANVVSTIALFLALSGGAAVALDRLPRKSVGAPQLRPGAVTAHKLRKNSVRAPKILAKAVKTGKIANFAVREAKLANAAVTNPKLANWAVSAEKVLPGSLTGAQINEATLGEVPKADDSDTAEFASSANPLAFAKVDQEGNVDTSLSKGIGSGNVTQGKEPGIYCVSTPGFSPRGAQVTPEYNGSSGLNAFVTIGGTGSCRAPQIEVQMHNAGPVKAPFYISLYR